MFATVLSKFKSLATPPHLPDEDSNYRAILVMRIAEVLLFTSAISAVPFILSDPSISNIVTTVLGNGLTILVSLLVMVWARAGNYQKGSAILIVTISLITTLNGLLVGLDYFPVNVYLLAIAMAALFFGSRGALVSGGISVLVMLSVVSINIFFIDNSQSLLYEHIVPDTLLNMGVMIFISVLLYIGMTHLEHAQLRSRQAEANLLRLNDNLENLVAERTAKLETTSRLLQALMGNSPMPIYIKTAPDWHYQVANRRFEALSGQTLNLTLNQTDYDFYPPEIAEASRITDEVVLETRNPVTVEVELPDPDGELHTLLATKFPILDHDNQIYAIGGMSLDITERKRMEAALMHQYELLATLNRITLDLLNRIEPGEILERLLNHTLKLLDTEHANIDLLENNDQIVTHIATPGQPLQKGDRLQRGVGGFLTWQAMDTGEPAIVNDYHQWDLRRNVFDGFPYHAVAQVPMIRENKVIGVLSISRTQPNYPFTDDDIDNAKRLAQIAAVVLDNAQLYDEARREIAERKRVEAELREAQIKYQNLVEQVPAVVYVSEPGGQNPWLFVSPQIQTLLGFSEEEWLADPLLWSRQIHVDDRDIVLKYEDEFAGAPASEFGSIEYRLVTRDDRVIWVRDSAIAMWNEARRQYLWHGILLDITASKEIAEKLRETEAKYREIYEGVADVIYETDRYGRVTSVSPSIERQSGYRAEDVLGQTTLKFYADPDDYRTLLSNLSSAGEINDYEVRLKRKSGETVFASATIHIKSDPDGMIVGTRGVLRDITVRKQAEAALKESEERYRLFFRDSLDAIYLLDLKTRQMIDANPTFMNLLGFEQQEVCSLTLYDILPYKRSEVDEFLERIVQNKGLVLGERQWRRKDGRLVDVLVSASLVLQKGELVIFVVAHDISERVQAEADLRRQNEYLSALHQVTLSLLNRHSVDELLEAIVEHAEHITGSPYVNIDLLEDEDRLVTKACTANLAVLMGSVALRGKEGFLSWQAIESRLPVVIEDYATYPERRDFFDPGRLIHATADMPIVVGGKSIGILSIGRSEPDHPYTPDDIHFTSLLTELTALVLDSIQHYEVAQSELAERKHLEAALRRSETRYRTLIEASSDAITAMDQYGNILLANSQAARMFGFESAAATVGKSIFDYLSPDELARGVEQFQNLLATGTGSTAEYIALREDGTRIPTETTVGVVWGLDGSIESIVANTRDITSRLQAEQAVKESEERYRDLYENNPLMLFTLNIAGIVLAVNRTVVGHLGYGWDELVGKSVLQVFHPEEYQNVLKTFHEFVRDPIQTMPWEFRKVTKNGRTIFVSETARLTHDSGGNPIVLIVCEDITVRKQAETELQRRTQELILLDRVRTALARELNLTALIKLIVASMAEALGYTHISIYLLEADELVLQHQLGYEHVIEKVSLTQGVIGRVVRVGKPIFLEDAHVDADFLEAIPGITSEICVPLMDEDRIVGVLNVESINGVKLTPEDLALVTALGEHISVAIGKARLYTTVQRELLERTQAEQKLLQFRNVLDHSNDAIFLIDPLTGRYVDFNLSACTMLGYSREELGNVRVIEVAQHVTSMNVWAESVAWVWSNQGATVDTVYKRKNGTLLPVEVSSQVIQYGDREIMLSIARDITERRQAAEKLRKAEAKYREIYESVNDVIYETDYHGVVTAVSPSVEKWDGYVLDEIIGHHVVNFYAFPEDYQRLEAVIESQRMVNDFEIRMRRKAGGVIYVSVTAQVIFDAHGQPVGTRGVLRDITERKHAEERIAALNIELEDRVQRRTAQLQQVNDFLSTLVETSIKINRSLEVQEVLDHILEQGRKFIPCRGINLMLVENGQAYVARRIGYGGENELERDLSDFKYPLTWTTFDQMIANNKGINISDTRNDPIWRATTATSWIRSFIGMPLKDTKGETIGFLNAAHDSPEFFNEDHMVILDALASHAALALQNARLLADLKTALKNEKAAQSQLVQSERLALAGRLLATVSHELNNPIQAIQNTLYLLKDETSISEQGHQDLGILLAETDRMAALIERLRSVYRPIRAEEFLLVQFNSIIDDIHMLTAAQMRHKRIKYEAILDPALPTLPGNPDQLKQVILNLVVNSIEAVPEGGMITIQTRAGENEIVFSVRDSGPGIEPELLPNIFHAFVTNKNTGTGLGLTIVHEIIQRHHGRVEAVNNPEGGAMFTIWLPIHHTQEQP